jgi:hypothetical protein
MSEGSKEALDAQNARSTMVTAAIKQRARAGRGGGLAGPLLLALCTLALFATPWRSRFSVRADAVCELRAPLALWASGAANLQHLLTYGILAILAAFVFRRQPLLTAVILVLGVSAVVELQQAIFTAGHCRLRDMLPNLLAVGLGTGVWASMRRWHRTASREPRSSECNR